MRPFLIVNVQVPPTGSQRASKSNCQRSWAGSITHDCRFHRRPVMSDDERGVGGSKSNPSISIATHNLATLAAIIALAGLQLSGLQLQAGPPRRNFRPPAPPPQVAPRPAPPVERGPSPQRQHSTPPPVQPHPPGTAKGSQRHTHRQPGPTDKGSGAGHSSGQLYRWNSD
jgi:hypothetical protein